jgi:hypothetical protein
MSCPTRQSGGRCFAARPSTSSAEAPQATTTARVNAGERPRRLARVTMRRGPCRRTSASAITRLTGGVRSAAGIGARIETLPFPGWFGKRGCRRTRPRDAGRAVRSSRPSAYDPSDQMRIWQYPFEAIRDICRNVSGVRRRPFLRTQRLPPLWPPTTRPGRTRNRAIHRRDAWLPPDRQHGRRE